MADIIRFPGGRSAPAGALRNPSFDYGDVAPRTRNRRNPLRKHINTLSIAITEENKLDHPDPEWRNWIRRGAESARILADELGRLADRLEG